MAKQMYIPRRTFGIEIECYGPPWSTLESELRKAEIPHRGFGNTSEQWRFMHDPTVHPPWGTGSDRVLELVSPILRGEDGIKQVLKVCKILKRLGYKTNASCGLHVHVGISDLTPKDIYTVIKRYAAHEKEIDQWMKNGRRKNNSSYCRSALDSRQAIWKSYNRWVKYKKTGKFSDPKPKNPFKSVKRMMYTGAERGRYCKINTAAYSKHRTMEFRHHHGTVSGKKITAWIRFILGFVSHAKKVTKNLKPRERTGNSALAGMPKEIEAHYKRLAKKKA